MYVLHSTKRQWNDYMRMNTLEKLYLCLRDESPAIEVDEAIRERAVRPIHKMLEMSK